MQQLLDFIAILAFVIVYFVTKDIFLATGVLMVGVAIQTAAYWLLKKPISNELKITFWASMVLGGMTLLLRDETFIQWKPTIVNWLLAVALVIAHLWRKVFLIEKMLGQVLDLPERGWVTLNYGWAIGFFVAGAANIFVAYTYSMDTWVTFKFAGLMAINIFYMIATFVYLHSQGWLTEEHLKEPNKDSAAAKEGD